LQEVFCDTEARCEPVLRSESYHGVCVGESTDQLY